MGKECCPCNFTTKPVNEILRCEGYEVGRPCVDSDSMLSGSGTINKQTDGIKRASSLYVTQGIGRKSGTHAMSSGTLGHK